MSKKLALIFSRKSVVRLDHSETVEDRSQANVLLREVFARKHVHWLDGFVLFAEWRTRPHKDPLRKLFTQAAAKASRTLKELKLKNVWVGRVRGEEHEWMLRAPGDEPPSSNIDEGRELARLARARFAANDPTGWRLLADAFTKWGDPLSLADTLTLAPCVPDPGSPHASLAVPIAKVLRQHAKNLFKAPNKTHV